MRAPSEASAASRLALFAAGAGFLYACGLHRFTTALHYAYIGGYEIAHGRLPYRDFSFLTGPALIFIQAAFFKIFGYAYATGYLAHAALFNGLAAVMTADVVTRRTKNARWGLAAGALTVVWYYSVFMAAPWYDHEAHFFLIAALWLLHRKPGRFWPGALASVSFFCKQSHGAFGLVFLCLYVWSAEGLGAALAFTAGGTAGVFAMAFACSRIAGWAPFWHDFVFLPLHSGRVSFTHEPRFWALALPAAAALLLAPRLRGLRLFAVPLGFSVAAIVVQSPVFLVFLLPLFLWPWLETLEERALVLALLLIQLDGRLTSNNEIKIYWPFLGVFFSLLRQAVSRLNVDEKDADLWRTWLWTWWAFMLAWGVRLSYLHKIQNPFPGSTFLAAGLAAVLAIELALTRPRTLTRRLAILALGAGSGVLAARGWMTLRAHLSNPSFMAGHEDTRPSRRIDEPLVRGVMMDEPNARGLEAVLPKLRALPPERKPFFLYCECDILYSFLDQPLPHFWWFDPTSTFRPGDGTEDQVIDFLKKEKYGTFGWCPAYSSMMEMPKLESWVKAHTRFDGDYGGYRLYEIVQDKD